MSACTTSQLSPAKGALLPVFRTEARTGDAFIEEKSHQVIAQMSVCAGNQ